MKRKIGEDGEFVDSGNDSKSRKCYWAGVFTPIAVAIIGAIALVASGNQQVVVRLVNVFSDAGYQGLIDQSVQSTLTALPSQTPRIETSAPQTVEVQVTSIVTSAPQIMEVQITSIVERVITSTPIAPVATAVPTTATPVYYEGNRGAEIESSVRVYIWDRLPNPAFIGCFVAAYDYPAFSLGLTVANTSSHQFLLRFESYAFGLVDNTGREYRVRAAGIGGCTKEPGLRSQILDPGDDVNIMLAFEGEIGMDVEYFLLTVENISGSGPFVFRKEI